MTKKHAIAALLTLCVSCALGQEFVTLTEQELAIDSLLPVYTYSRDIGYSYADSAFTIAIEYPEFADMSDEEIKRYNDITAEPLPALPAVTQSVSVDRKRGTLDVSFVPLVYREGKYRKLTSFKLNITSRDRAETARTGGVTRAEATASATRTRAAGDRYAASSVLSSGTWAKIRVPESGVYELTKSVISHAGFSDLSKIKVYGYGGAIQDESLTEEYLIETDDLAEVATYSVGERRFFHAQGPVTWSTSNTIDRIRNPYSDYGYYFITESDDEPLTVDSATFFASFYPADEDYNALYEVDDYAWYNGGRNLYDADVFTIGEPKSYTIASPGKPGAGSIRIVVTADAAVTATVKLNGDSIGRVSGTFPSSDENLVANRTTSLFNVDSLMATNTVTITQTSGGTMRLDYICTRNAEPRDPVDLETEDVDAPEYVYNITNQDLHAHGAVDMVIIIPTSQELLAQAERLKVLHEEYDGMTVRIVPADEIFNEFSSGTPDATAYRRYMKMLYDRAETEDEMPKYLLLFGDGAWDNRMHTSAWSGYDPDDFLLCFESKNSLSATMCYTSDDFFCMLDDEEVIYSGTDTESVTTSSSSLFKGKPDVAVGRFPVRSSEQAEIMVDKIETYMGNGNAGAWQNTVVFMGDDGDDNVHMESADAAAQVVEALDPAMDIRKIIWDAYTRESSATGYSYPDVERLVEQYMTDGALIMNYTGHGNAYSMSHEGVFNLSDFTDNVNDNLPLWFTAACDIAPYDGQEDNIGEEAVLNADGGAVAFIGTARTVYANVNESMNNAFLYELFSGEDGENVAIGEALRAAKNDLISPISSEHQKYFSSDNTVNKFHYVLLGDPAMKLARPTLDITIDSINGMPADGSEEITLKAGEAVTATGHVYEDGGAATTFNGLLTATVKDAEEEVVCKLNDTSEASEAFTYYDRANVIFKGTDSVSAGRFSFSFSVPKDIKYSDESCQIIAYAVNDDNSKTAHGENESFALNGTGSIAADSIGPSVYCYLNSTSFKNGGDVNTTPCFFAEIYDESGINSSGNGIGHDLELIVDGETAKTYVLNDYFTYDFGSYQSGTLEYNMSELETGEHTLLFRAWDVLNNSSTAELTFNVVDGLEPQIFDVTCTNNPATTSTAFRITHDRAGSELDVRIEVYDMSGRQLWEYQDNTTSASGTLTIDWDLTIDGGRRLGTGVYVYRANIASDGSTYASDAKKLIVISNK